MSRSEQIGAIAQIARSRTAQGRHGDAVLFHDMQQPIAAMRWVLGALEDRRDWTPEDLRLIEVAANQAEALQAMIDERLNRMRAQATSGDAQHGAAPPGLDAGESADAAVNGPSVVVSLDQVVRSVIEPLRLTKPGRVAYYVTDRPPVFAAPLVLRRAIANVVTNAVEATDPAGTVQIVLGSVGRTAVLTVDDSGAGFGHKPAGRGLGLAGSMAAVLGAGGEMTYRNSRLGGVRVCLEIPVGSS